MYDRFGKAYFGMLLYGLGHKPHFTNNSGSQKTLLAVVTRALYIRGSLFLSMVLSDFELTLVKLSLWLLLVSLLTALMWATIFRVGWSLPEGGSIQKSNHQNKLNLSESRSRCRIVVLPKYYENVLWKYFFAANETLFVLNKYLH